MPDKLAVRPHLRVLSRVLLYVGIRQEILVSRLGEKVLVRENRDGGPVCPARLRSVQDVVAGEAVGLRGVAAGREVAEVGGRGGGKGEEGGGDEGDDAFSCLNARGAAGPDLLEVGDVAAVGGIDVAELAHCLVRGEGG